MTAPRTFFLALLLSLSPGCADEPTRSDPDESGDRVGSPRPSRASTEPAFESQPLVPNALSGAARGHNVVLITLDTTRADHLGCYGSTTARTPILDGIARQGVLVERALSVAPITLPSHASILSGLYPIDHGVRDNGIFEVPERTPMLAELLGREGYATAAFVSAFVLQKTYGIHQGFDTYDDHMVGAGGREIAHVERRAALTVNAALRWLEDAPPEPWFLWLHFYDPHQPFDPPEPFDRQLVDPYDGEIAYADSQLGRFLTNYDVDGRLDRTVLAVTSDHGDGLGEHLEETHGLFVYDATMLVPMLWRHPSLGTQRRLRGQVVIIDVFPTLLDLLGVPPSVPLRGGSLLPALADLDEAAPQLWHDAYLETQMTHYMFGLAPIDAVSDSGFKYIEAPRPELYAWPEDPTESRDLIDEKPEEAARLRARLLEFRAARGVLDHGPTRLLSA